MNGSQARGRPFVLGALFAIVLLVAGMVHLKWSGATRNARLDSTESTTVGSNLSPLQGELSTKNDSGRSGYFFLPERSPQTAIPLLVALHGQGGDGRDILSTFRELGAARHFAILAPSSRFAPSLSSFSWEVGDKPNDITPDYRHVLACLDELRRRPDFSLDANRVLIVGFSGGASSAPYIGTNAPPFTAFAVLHGGVFVGGLGSRKIAGWFSTGEADSARTPAHVFGHFH